MEKGISAVMDLTVSYAATTFGAAPTGQSIVPSAAPTTPNSPREESTWLKSVKSIRTVSYAVNLWIMKKTIGTEYGSIALRLVNKSITGWSKNRRRIMYNVPYAVMVISPQPYKARTQGASAYYCRVPNCLTKEDIRSWKKSI